MVSHHPRHSIEVLPPELLAEIFVHCLPSRSWVPESPRIYEAPMLLCQVCSYWRELAISLPFLWSSLRGYMDVSNRAQLSHLLLYQLWIERSRTRPLSLYIDLDSSDPSTSFLMNLFLAEIHRWGDIVFYFDYRPAKDFFAIDGRRAHLLHSLSIRAYNCFEASTVDKIPSILQSFPNLRCLRWSSQVTPMTLLKTPFPRLTHIKLLKCPLPLVEFVRFISQCPQIRDIEVDAVKPPSKPFTLPVITLPHLSSLRVGTIFRVDEMIDYFTLPSLRYLEYGKVQIQSFENFASRSSCKLEAFHLKDYLGVTEEEALYLLAMPSLQSLRELGIRVNGITDRLLELLKYSEANLKDNILPHLEGLSLVGCRTTDGVFSDMVASRWRPTQGSRNDSPTASLRSVSVDFEHRQHTIDRSRLQEFEANGLTVWLMDVPTD
jgi:hypothetical protein